MTFSPAYRAVAILVTLTLAAILAILFYMGLFKDLLRDNYTFYTTSPTKAGVEVGQSVRFEGLDWEIGTITDVSLLANRMVQIDFLVEARYAEMIGEDSVVFIDTGLLSFLSSGITISPKSMDAAELESGRLVASAASQEGKQILKNLRYSQGESGDIDEILASVNSLLGALAGPDSALLATLENVEGITRQLRYGEGPVPALINSRELVGRIDGLLVGLDDLLKEINGIVQQQGENLDVILQRDVRQITQRIDNTIETIEDQANLILLDVEGVVSTAAATTEDLLSEVNERVEVLLDEVTEQTLLAVNDIMLLARTVLRDVALNVDPVLKMLISRVASAATTVLEVGEQTVIDVAADLRDVSGRLKQMTSDGQELLSDTSEDIRRISGGVARALDSLDALLLQVAQSPLLGGGSGSSTTTRTPTRIPPPTTRP